MKKMVLLLLVIIATLLGCTSNNNSDSLTEMKKINIKLDEAYGTKDGLWFQFPNIDFSSFNLVYKDRILTYSWTLHIHEYFYERLLEKNSNINFKLLIPTEFRDLINTYESLNYTIKVKELSDYSNIEIKVPIKIDVNLTNDEIELLRNELFYYVIFMDENQKELIAVQINTTINNQRGMLKRSLNKNDTSY